MSPITPGRRLAGVTAATAVALASALAAAPTSTAAPAPEHAKDVTIRGAGSPTAIAGSYIVILNDTAATSTRSGVQATATSLATAYKATVKRTFATVRGFSATMTAAKARTHGKGTGLKNRHS